MGQRAEAESQRSCEGWGQSSDEKGSSLVGTRRKKAGCNASRIDGLGVGGEEGSRSFNPDLFSPFQAPHRLEVFTNNRSVNGCFENKSRKFLFPRNHLDSWKRLFLCKDYPPNKNISC